MIASTAGRIARRALAATLICVPLPVVAAEASALHWELVDAHTSAGLRGLHRAGDSAWASGANGVVLRSADRGETWQSCTKAAGRGEALIFAPCGLGIPNAPSSCPAVPRISRASFALRMVVVRGSPVW